MPFSRSNPQPVSDQYPRADWFIHVAIVYKSTDNTNDVTVRGEGVM